jgi:hypothetical protein
VSIHLLDDHILLRVLLDDEPATLRPTGAALATTGLWYHRLCRALTDNTVQGSLSRRLGTIDPSIATGVVANVIDLPATIELLSLRSIGWPMAQKLRNGPLLNLMSLEALTVAARLNAEICLAEHDDNNPLRTAAAQLGIVVRTFGN